MKTNAKLLLTIFIAVLLVSISVFAVNAGDENIWTDQWNYYPEQTVPIHGEYFAEGTYAIPVQRPDGTFVTGDGTFTTGFDNITSATDGTFTYNYQLDGILGIYTVKVYNSPWSGDWTETPLASTTFQDAPPQVDLTQLANGRADDPATTQEWIKGNVNPNKAHYMEGYSIPYRGVMSNLPWNTPIWVEFGYDTLKNDKHALDYLTHYNNINDPSHYLVFGHNPEEILPTFDIPELNPAVY